VHYCVAWNTQRPSAPRWQTVHWPAFTDYTFHVILKVMVYYITWMNFIRQPSYRYRIPSSRFRDGRSGGRSVRGGQGWSVGRSGVVCWLRGGCWMVNLCFFSHDLTTTPLCARWTQQFARFARWVRCFCEELFLKSRTETRH
jgi:hypothetical protein